MTHPYITPSREMSRIGVTGELWAQIVLAARESPDARLRQLIEQAAAGAALDARPNNLTEAAR